jgi:hypothetical protein
MTTPLIANLEKLLAAGKDGALLRFGLGNAYLEAGDPGAAAGPSAKAVTMNPNYSAAWKLLARRWSLREIPTARWRPPEQCCGSATNGRQADPAGDGSFHPAAEKNDPATGPSFSLLREAAYQTTAAVSRLWPAAEQASVAHCIKRHAIPASWRAGPSLVIPPIAAQRRHWQAA